MLDGAMDRDGLALVRNPRFRIWSPAARLDGNVNRIEWTFGVGARAQFEAVAAGEIDFGLDASSAPGALEEMSVRFPAQVHTSQSAGTLFIVLNTKARPFDDVDVRRAINLALDRDRVVAILGGGAAEFPTCQQLPPNFPGYEPYCPYTMHQPGPKGWTAPDLEKAKILIDRSGTDRTPVTFEYTTKFLGPAARDLGDYMVEVLDDLGYQARARSLPAGDLYDPGNEFQMALGAWIADYPSAANFFTNQFMCGASQTPSAAFCDPQIDEMIERAIRVQVRDPAASGLLWAAVDRAIVRQAPYAWLTSGIAADFVSERVNNYQWSLQRQAVLLEQLWVQ